MFLKFKEAIGANKNNFISLDIIKCVEIRRAETELYIYRPDDSIFFIEFENQESLNRAYKNLCKLLNIMEI